MTRTRAPKIDRQALKASGQSDQLLEQMKSRFSQFEAQRKDKQTPIMYIALEALSAILGARIAGKTEADIAATYPPEWDATGITLPISIVAAINNAWLAYKAAPSGKTVGEAFGLEGGRQGTAPAKAKQSKRDRRRHLANRVSLEYLAAADIGSPISLEVAIQKIAEEEGVSFETVKSAYQVFRDEIEAKLAERGIIQRG